MKKPFNKIAAAAALLSGIAFIVPAQAQTAADAALAAEVKTTLLQTLPFKDADVDLAVTASNGKVNLAGWVTYANDPEFARKVAASVNGVTQVTTNLRTWSSEDDYRVR